MEYGGGECCWWWVLEVLAAVNVVFSYMTLSGKKPRLRVWGVTVVRSHALFQIRAQMLKTSLE